MKAVSGITLTLLLMGMLTLAFNIQSARAEPTTIFVPDDYEKIQWAIGNASDGDTIFVKAGTYYEHVVVSKSVSLVGENRSNTIIDGEGTGTVVQITANNVNISKFTMQNGFWGIDLGYRDDTHNNMVSSNDVVSNKRVGILLGSHTSNNILRDNNITGSQLNLYLYTWAPSKAFNHDIDPSNTVDGKPIYYLVNQHNQQIPQDAGYVAAVNCTNITVRNLNLQKNIHGVLFVNANHSTVENVTILDTVYGIFLRDSNNNTIYKNTVSGLSEMTDGIWLDGSGNNVSSNTLRVENGIGVFIEGPRNTISNNNIVECGGGIRVQSENNIIYHNNFVDNWVYQALVLGYTNTLDDGFPSGGNYWSDYEERYPDAEELDNSGIWNTPYVIDENNADRYPLMKPMIGPISRSIRIKDAETGLDSITLGSSTEPMPSKGYPFTVNVTLNGATNYLHSFQVAVAFDKTKVKCTAAWIPKWDQNFVFYGETRMMGFVGIYNDKGLVVLGSSLASDYVTPDHPIPRYVNVTGEKLLCHINFTTIETGASTLELITTQEPIYPTWNTVLTDTNENPIDFTKRDFQ